MKRIEMSFLPDVSVLCESCGGARFNPETLAVRFRDKSIADVLAMSVEEAAEFFSFHPAVHHSLSLLLEVGLGYLHLGQQSPSLSGGEAQRIKLVTELARTRAGGRSLYLLDEPTIGLHMADVERLIRVLVRLVEAGNTVVIIEHNLDVIAEADWIVDLGPEGGDGGGRIVAQGTPAEVARRTLRLAHRAFPEELPGRTPQSRRRRTRHRLVVGKAEAQVDGPHRKHVHVRRHQEAVDDRRVVLPRDIRPLQSADRGHGAGRPPAATPAAGSRRAAGAPRTGSARRWCAGSGCPPAAGSSPRPSTT